jgi:hypothetical protein
MRLDEGESGPPTAEAPRLAEAGAVTSTVVLLNPGLSQRLKEQFAPAYLTLTSAQLAVALAALGGTIAIIASSIPMSNRIPRFAHGEPVPAARRFRVRGRS